jgi:hypothetical protein
VKAKKKRHKESSLIMMAAMDDVPSKCVGWKSEKSEAGFVRCSHGYSALTQITGHFASSDNSRIVFVIEDP